MLGNPCDLNGIGSVAQKHGLRVIEDACQANGGSYKGRKLGGWGDMGGLPRTDSLLSRAVNLSVGVVDAGWGAGFGINIESSPREIELAAARFREACRGSGMDSDSV